MVIPQQSCFCENSRDHGLIYSIQMCLAECKRVKPGNREFMIAPLEPENSICVFCFRRPISLHSSIVNHCHATKEFSRGRCARSKKNKKTSPKMLVCGVTHTKGMQLRYCLSNQNLIVLGMLQKPVTLSFHQAFGLL